jgi:hypothetical protein
MATPVNLDELLTPEQAVEYLQSRNVKRTLLTLAKGRWRRDGSTPPYRKLDSRVYYIESEIDGWLRDKLSPAFASTSAAHDHEARSAQQQGASVDGAPVVPSMASSGVGVRRWP